MTIKVEQLPGEPILVATFAEPMDFHEDTPRMFQQFIERRDTDLVGYSRYYTVIDTTHVRIGFSDIVTTLGESRLASQQRREDISVTLILVGSGRLMELATKAVGQNQYGNYGMRLFTSLDEALEIVREELADIAALES